MWLIANKHIKWSRRARRLRLRLGVSKAAEVGLATVTAVWSSLSGGGHTRCGHPIWPAGLSEILPRAMHDRITSYIVSILELGHQRHYSIRVILSGTGWRRCCTRLLPVHIFWKQPSSHPYIASSSMSVTPQGAPPLHTLHLLHHLSRSSGRAAHHTMTQPSVSSAREEESG